ncbi:MAG TPA: sigma-70 family RNA polymerase sigma factor [Nocardioidaceae bacterium]|nr:sigma-70 family RNA polymerase sigma factor [Nocardioidaceae bacterium]
MATDDSGLATRFAAGDPETIRVVYRRYGRLVYSVAYKVLGDADLAEEATQQTFLQAWRAAESYDPSRPLGAWLAGIARRAAIDAYRRERRHRGVVSIDSANSADPTLVTTPPSVEQISDVWEVRQAVEKLPDQDRELIRLQHYAELTHTEIADELAIPLGTVKSRSFRAHRRLAGLLGHLRPESSTQGAGRSPETRQDEKGDSDERR